jgi:DNA-binding transcriptional regulator YhcF (GntR family)
MQLWLSHGSEVSIREQLATQVVLAILSEDLAPGQRLPSTRELARRFHLHPNTISAGYRQLERDRWVEFRHGSGVYVRDKKPKRPLSSSLALDQLIANLFRSARDAGTPLGEVRARMRQWLELQPPDHFLVIEPTEELREILVAEMKKALTFRVEGCSLQECRVPGVLDGAIPVALPNKLTMAGPLLPEGTELLTLQVSSVPTSLAEWLPAPAHVLVGVASKWPEFLKLARIVLNAAEFHPDNLLLRDARKPRWQRGLEQTAAVICDAVTATHLPKDCLAIPFPVLSESSLAELRRYQEFVRSPLAP